MNNGEKNIFFKIVSTLIIQPFAALPIFYIDLAFPDSVLY